MRLTIRLRVAALCAALAVGCVALVLGASFLLIDGFLKDTLEAGAARDISNRLAAQYVLATLGVALLASALGYLIASRALAPVGRMATVAQRVSRERLGERIALDGPQDELRDLADALDAMLDRLQAAVEAQGRFVANASHELRTPLTVLRTEAEVTLEDPDATREDLRHMGEVVIETTDRTAKLLDGLLVLTTAMQGEPRKEKTDLGRLARRALDSTSREAAAAQVTIESHLVPATVTGDPALLERMVANLLENAVRHNRPGGTAYLSMRIEHDRVHLHVVNDGERIPDADVERLTAPFQRLRRTHDGKGAGLGLSIVQAVVDAHGGTLELRARPEGGLDAEVGLPYSA